MNYILFEDSNYLNFTPFSLNHAVFEIRTGLYSNIQRVVHLMNDNDKLYLFVRKELAGVVSERYPHCIVNPSVLPPGIWLNGRYFWQKPFVQKVKDWIQYFSSDGHLIAFVNMKEEEGVFPDLNDHQKDIMDICGLNFIWDSVLLTGKYLTRDNISYLRLSETAVNRSERTGEDNIHPEHIRVCPENIYCGQNLHIGAGVILDATNGPIILGHHVKLDIGVLIKGPTYIGDYSVINPGAKIRENVSIGSWCKVGGEVEDSVLHAFSNKQHDGFLGHSYIGEWVNLGANTNTSDLKNNYSSIRLNQEGRITDTGHQFIGLMMGDYSKSGISTMFNTGSYVGFGANVFGGDFQPKYIPSFSWGRGDVTNVQKFLKTCEIVKSRRGLSLTDVEKKLILYLYKSYQEIKS